ncbi:hypothetical protein ACHAWF_003582 [Thalassiosira exigua]
MTIMTAHITHFSTTETTASGRATTAKTTMKTKVGLFQLLASIGPVGGLLHGGPSPSRPQIFRRLHPRPRPWGSRADRRCPDDARHGRRGASRSSDSDGGDASAPVPVVGRRDWLHSAGMSLAGTASSGPFASLLRSLDAEADASGRGRRSNSAANAMGLVQFPCPPGALTNTYHLMRAGESGLEAEGVLSTNSLFLTNREDALTDLGIAQVEEACDQMMSKGINPSVVKYSLAAKCIDAANIVATKMMVGRNRIVPEFTFMGELCSMDVFELDLQCCLQTTHWSTLTHM